MALLGVALGAWPVLLHLLQKRQRRRVPWAMMWLLTRVDTQRRRIYRWKDRTLLLLRVLLIAAMSLAFAGPRLPVDRQGLLGFLAPDVTALVIDASGSMRREQRFVDAVQRAREVLGELGEQTVLLFRAAEELEGIGDPAGQPASAAWPLLPELVATDAATDLGAALLALAGLEPAPDRVLLFTDLQRNSFPERSRASLAALQEFSRRSELVVLAPAPAPDPRNIAVTAVFPWPDGFASADQDTLLHVRVYNRGPARPAELQLHIGRALQARWPVDLPSHSHSDHALTWRFRGPGAFRVEVAVAPGDDGIDDSFPRVIEVLSQQPVGFLRSATPPLHEGTYYVQTFLDPGRDPSALFTAENLDEGTLAEFLTRASLLVVDDSRHLSGEAGHAILRWVESGGQLVWFVADPGVPEAGEPWWPAALRELRTATEDPAALRRLDLHSLHPLVLRPWQPDRAWNQALADLRFPVTFRAEPAPGAVVLGRYDDGTPFLVERRLGDGRVWMLTTSCDPTHSNFALSPGLALVDRMFRALLRPEPSPWNVTAGQRLYWHGTGPPPECFDARGTWLPWTQETSGHPGLLPGFRTGAVLHRGFVEADSRSGSVFAVHGAPEEAEEQPMLLAELEARYPGVRWQPAAASAGAGRRDASMTPLLLAFVALLALVELAVAAWFRPPQGAP